MESGHCRQHLIMLAWVIVDLEGKFLLQEQLCIVDLVVIVINDLFEEISSIRLNKGNFQDFCISPENVCLYHIWLEIGLQFFT